MASPGEIPEGDDPERAPLRSLAVDVETAEDVMPQDEATESERDDEMQVDDDDDDDDENNGSEQEEEPVEEEQEDYPDDSFVEEAPAADESNDDAAPTNDDAEESRHDVTGTVTQPEEVEEMEEEGEIVEEGVEEAEVESSTRDESESVARSSRSQTAVEEPMAVPTYSTRGRYQKEEDPLEALLAGVRAQGEEEKEMIAATATATSFLESLSEEDRRTRTRHLPDVEGFHPLYKSEVKSDLSLARSVTSSTGVSSKLASSRRLAKTRKTSKDEDQMDVDDEGTGASEDERLSEAGAPVVELDHREFSVPSKVFVAPKVTDGENGSVSSTKQPKSKNGSPYVVEAITAFNPPRPPESVGAKKKHRLLRWERRPQDIDVDLNNYKKTVRRTREELRNAERERERIQMFGAIMRVHFRDQLELLNEESQELNEALASIQTECVSAADLLTSRTRSRGAGKGSYLMRDVISVLKARGAELAEKGYPPIEAKEDGNGVTGFGGVTSFGFVDWDKSTDVPVQKLAIGWTLPGDQVATPYGDGIALHVFGPSILDVNEALPIGLRPKPPPASNGPESSADVAANPEVSKSAEDTDVVMEPAPKEGDSKEENRDATSATGDAAVRSNEMPASSAKDGDNASNLNPEKTSSNDSIKKDYHMDQILAPRVCVQLPFGIGFFPVGEVKSKENPAFYSDGKLASRWKKMIKTSELVGSCLDVSGMESVVRASVVDREYKIQSSMEIDEESEENASGTEAKVTSNEALDKAKRRTFQEVDVTEDFTSSERFVPYGACLLPTDAGRGSLLEKAPLTALEPAIHDEMFQATGALGDPNNPGVPRPAKTWENMRQESYTLQSRVLHLRNELHRQKRIRALNERTHATFRDRSLRAEALVAEMKADLKSLKSRLGDEVGELGIDREKAGGLLASHYKEKDSAEYTDTEPGPPKRTRRAAAKEASQQPAGKITRRRRRENSSDLDNIVMSGQTDDYEDAQLASNANSSEEDMEGSRATKRARTQ